MLCGVYARREAFFGNIDHARRVFDMALSSIEGLPLVKSNGLMDVSCYVIDAEVCLCLKNGSDCDLATCRTSFI